MTSAGAENSAGKLRPAAAWLLGPLVLVVTLCWWWIVLMSLDMYGPMRGPAAWMMTAPWDWQHLALLFAMWSVMMAGMMLPSAFPAVIRYARRRSHPAPQAAARSGAFVIGYTCIWVLFSAAATLLQRAKSELRLLTPMMEPAAPTPAICLLVAAGVYQLSPDKRGRLASCRDTALESGEESQDVAGAFWSGAHYGRACLQSNWLLMLLPFVGGVMNLEVMAGLTLLVLVEKAGRLGMRSTIVSGVLLIGLGVWMLIH